jgi:hypothetical protein
MTPMTSNTLSVIATGFTHYVNIGKDSDAAIYYENNESVHMLLPGATAAMRGTWSLLPDGYYVRWVDGPEGKWQIARDADGLTYIDPTGKPAGRVSKIVPGPAGLF